MQNHPFFNQGWKEGEELSPIMKVKNNQKLQKKRLHLSKKQNNIVRDYLEKFIKSVRNQCTYAILILF